jgi:hypothetical protein
VSPIRSAVSVFLSFFLSFSLAAQQSTATQQGPLLLQNSLAAMAGGTTLKDVTLTGTARRIAGSDDETGTATLTALSTGETRINLSLPSGAPGEVRANSANGPVGQWTGADGTPHAVSQHNLLGSSSWFFSPFTLAAALSDPNSVISYVAHETFDGNSVEHISISSQFASLPASQTTTLLQHLSRMEIYLDSTTLFPRALAFNTHPDNNALLDIPVIVRYSNYQPVNGAQIAFHVQKFVNNTLVLDLQFQSANLNTGLSATDFNLASSSPPTRSNVVAAADLALAVKP